MNVNEPLLAAANGSRDVLQAENSEFKLEEDVLHEDSMGMEQPLSWAAEENLDSFFRRLYVYWEGKGFWVILIGECLNVLALAFTGAASGALLIGIDYGCFKSSALHEANESIWEACFHSNLSLHPLSTWRILSTLYLIAFFCYWGFALVCELLKVEKMRNRYLMEQIIF